MEKGGAKSGDRTLAWRAQYENTCFNHLTAKLNDVDPRAWLADVLARIADHPVQRLHQLLPWNWRDAHTESAVAA